MVVYEEAPDEIRRTADGSLLEILLSESCQIHFAVGTNAPNFVVEYRGAPAQVRRTVDGSLIETLSGNLVHNYPAQNVIFSPDTNAKSFIVNYLGAPDEIRRTADGSLLAVLTGWTDHVYFGSGMNATYFVVDYRDAFGELRRTADGSLLKPLSGEIEYNYPSERVIFSPDADATSFVVEYKDGRSELWEGRGHPRLLAELGLGVEGQFFDIEGQRLILWHSDGRAYLLGVDWLRAMGGDPWALSPEELMRLACEGPFASSAWDEAALEPYLDGRPSQACR